MRPMTPPALDYYVDPLPRRRDPAVPRVTTVTVDPCPECGDPLTAIHGEAQIVRTNRHEIITMPNPNCPWDGDGDGEGECICPPPIVNLNPDPMFDEDHIIGWQYTFEPCGHTAPTFRITETTDWEDSPAGRAGRARELYGESYNREPS